MGWHYEYPSCGFEMIQLLCKETVMIFMMCEDKREYRKSGATNTGVYLHLVMRERVHLCILYIDVHCVCCIQCHTLICVYVHVC